MSENPIPRYTRRGFLQKVVAPVGLAVAAAVTIPGCGKPTEAQTTNPESPALPQDYIYLGAPDETTGIFPIVNKPEVIKIKFMPVSGYQNNERFGNRVLISRHASEEDGKLENLDSDPEKIYTVIRVLGNGHTYGTTGKAKAQNAKGELIEGHGLWLAFTDEYGNLTDPTGKPIPKPTKLLQKVEAYCFPAGFADLAPQAPPAKTP